MTALALPAARAPGAWRRHALLLASIGLLTLTLFARDAADVATIWTSSTFSHCLLILPALAWLVWQRRGELARLTPVAWPPGLVVAGLGGALWILGEAGEIALLRHLALLAMLQGVVIALTGPAVARALAFPLAYAVFLVPFGAELVPALQSLTATMMMALLSVSGPAATIDGVFITTSAGLFEVAEACAGVNFLIAMLAFATLAAHLFFARWPRQLAFVGFALTASILANAIRAWGTVVIADQFGMETARGFDHLIYGWVFFAIVLAAVIVVGATFADKRPSGAGTPASTTPDRPWVAPALVAVLAAPLLWSATVANARTPLPNQIALPEIAGWTRMPLTGAPWSPNYEGADHRLLGRYRDALGNEVDLSFIVFAHQGEGRELVGFGQGAVAPDGAWTWSADAPPPPGGRAERLLGPESARREVWTFYRLGGVTTGSAARVKLATLDARLTGGDQAAVAVLLSSPDRAALARFSRALGPIDVRADAVVAQARGL